MDATRKKAAKIEGREACVPDDDMLLLVGVSVCRVDNITEAPWGVKVRPPTVSDLKQKIYAQIEACRNQPICGRRNGP